MEFRTNFGSDGDYISKRLSGSIELPTEIWALLRNLAESNLDNVLDSTFLGESECTWKLFLTFLGWFQNACWNSEIYDSPLNAFRRKLHLKEFNGKSSQSWQWLHGFEDEDFNLDLILSSFSVRPLISSRVDEMTESFLMSVNEGFLPIFEL